MAIFTALAGHVSAGGAMPGPLGILVPWMLAFMVCVLLAGRRLSVVRLGLSVAVSQFLFHALFVLGTVTPSGVSVGHVHGAPLQLPAVSAEAAMSTADGMMWFGHAIAAAVTVIVLHRGERMLLTLQALAAQAVRWVRRRIDAVLVAPSPLRTRGLAPAAQAPARPTSTFLSTRRGRAPPQLSAV